MHVVDFMSMCFFEVLHLYDIFYLHGFAVVYMHYTLLDMQICHKEHLCNSICGPKGNHDNYEP